MKEKILAQLILKYAGVSKKFLGLWADKLAAKVTEENQIEGALSELDNLPISIPDLATEYQKEGDSRVIDAKKEWLKAPPKPDKPVKTDPPTPDAPPDEMPIWFKPFADTLQGIVKGNAQKSMKDKLKANDKLKDVPEDFYDEWGLPENDDAIDAFADKVSAKYKAFTEKQAAKTQDDTNAAFSSSSKPAGSAGSGGKKETDPVFDAPPKKDK